MRLGVPPSLGYPPFMETPIWLMGLSSDLWSLEHRHYNFTKVSSYAAKPCRCSSLLEGAGGKGPGLFSPTAENRPLR